MICVIVCLSLAVGDNGCTSDPVAQPGGRLDENPPGIRYEYPAELTREFAQPHVGGAGGHAGVCGCCGGVGALAGAISACSALRV